MKKEWCVGRWQADSTAIDVIFEITQTAEGLRVQAVDEGDGEQLVVSKVKWDGKCLSFETRNPSNGWRTRNRLQPVSKNRAIQELTYWQPLKRISRKGRRIPAAASA